MKKIRIMAFVVALAVFMLSYLYINRKADTSANKNIKAKQVEAVIAKTRIPANTRITAEMVELGNIVIAETEADYYATLEEAIGRVAVTDIYEGEHITDKRTEAADAGSLSLAYRVTEGMRAMAVNVDARSGVGNNLRVGDMVDVLFSADLESSMKVNDLEAPAGVAMTAIVGEGNPANSVVFDEMVDNSFAMTAIQNVKVLALDNLVVYEKPAEMKEYTTVTLELTPVQAEQLALLSGDDSVISLTLRAQNDDDILNKKRSELYVDYNPDAEVAGGESVFINTEEAESGEGGTSGANNGNSGTDGANSGTGAGNTGSKPGTVRTSGTAQ